MQGFHYNYMHLLRIESTYIKIKLMTAIFIDTEHTHKIKLLTIIGIMYSIYK